MNIDFVVPWVDGSAPAWRKQRAQYMGLDEPDAGEQCYRDMGILRYWFRAVEAYAPWVNKVHFITWAHLPAWLDTDCPKLNIVKHEDYIPQQYLPVFNANPIELNLHRISGLSEQFVYFNDDVLLNGSVGPEFFFRNGIPMMSMLMLLQTILRASIESFHTSVPLFGIRCIISMCTIRLKTT